MKQMRLVSKGTILRIRQTARMAWEGGNLRQCAEILERVSRMDPADTGILLQLGRIQGLRYEYEAAEAAFEKAVQVARFDRKAEALAAAGEQARDFYSPEISMRYFKRAIEEKNATPEMFVKLADFYERLRRTEEATALVNRALQINGSCPSAQLLQARLALRAGRLEDAEKLLRPLLALGVNLDVRVRSWYELGAVLDRQGRYDEAMAAFLQAKVYLHRDGAPQMAQLRLSRAHLAQMVAQISPDILKRWAEFGQELQPPHRFVLLGGHPRSGTTLLEQVLDAHPDIASAEETNNFTDYAYQPQKRRFPEGTPMLQVLNSATREILASFRADYFRASELCLGRSLGGQLLIDKNPSLTVMIPAIARVFPESRFLVALRDPRDVCLSCFMQPFLPVQQVSSAYLSLEHTAQEYTALMGVWRALAPMLQNPFIEIRYEDMVEDLESIARKALAFLGVPWDERVLSFDEHARQKVVRSPTYADVTQKVFKRAMGRWRNYQKHIEPYLPLLEPFAKAFGYE